MSSSQSSKGGTHLAPGSLVFAKMKSFPAWPAKIITAEEYPGSVPKQQIPVLFLGSGDYGHVPPKECYPYVEYRSQFGTPKQRPKHADAIREADELVKSQEEKPEQEEHQQQQRSTKKRPAPKSQERKKPESAATSPTTTRSPPAKKARGATRGKSGTETDQPATSKTTATTRHEDEDLITTQKLLPASQLAEIAASTVFDAEPDTHSSAVIGDTAPKPQSSSSRGATAKADDDDEEEEVDDAITNVVRQLEELEKQEADEQRRSQTGFSPAPEALNKSQSDLSTDSKRRGRPTRKSQTSESSSPMARPMTLETKTSPKRVQHHRSLSETTDDGRGDNAALAGQSSGSETPLSGGEGGALGKRRHKPKIMSEYFLEYDYASPRAHRKSESSAAAPSTPPVSSSQASKSQQPKMTKSAASTSKSPGVRGRKPGASGSGTRTTKDLEKAALEAEIERVKMAAEENQTEQHASPDQQYWQRQEAFGDLPFDDSMFEVTVDVEEAPAGGATSGQAAFGGESSMTLSQAMAKRKRDAKKMKDEKEKERQLQKEKLKVKFLKGPLPPAPKDFAATSSAGKKKKKALAIVLPKKKPVGVDGKMKVVKMAKKRATKAAKLIAAAEMKGKKKRGRKPLSETKSKLEKRVTGYSLWAEREMEVLRQEHPEVKGLKNVRELLQARYKQLSETERKTFQIMAKREKEKRKREQDAVTKKGKGQKSPASSSASPGVSGYGRFPGTSTSPKGFSPSSPSRVFVMSPSHGGPPGMDLTQQSQLAYEQGAAMLGDQEMVYHQMGAAGLSDSAYNDPNSAAGYYGIHDPQEYSQSSISTPSPAKRPRGRPPKNPRPADSPQKVTPKPLMRLSASSSQDSHASPLLGYQAVLPKGLKIPKKEAATTPKMVVSQQHHQHQQQQLKPPLKILTVGQRRAPFQARSPQPIMHQGLQLGTLDDPPVPEAMSHEELVYDSETAAMAAAAAAAMEMEQTGMMEEGIVDEVAYGHVDPHHPQHEELGEETESAVSYLTGDQSQLHGGISKTRALTEEEKAAKKRESRRRSRARQKMIKEQKKMEGLQPGQQTTQTPQKRGDMAGAGQFGADEGGYGEEAVVSTTPGAYDATFEPRPSEEETNMFFFGTTQDVQALLETRNPPGPMEGQCRWWLADEIDPEMVGKSKRGSSPPRALTAEPLDAAAVFKLIGRTFETVGNQLMREEQSEDTANETAAGLDMLLDGLVSSISHLLTLTGAIPPFDRRYRRDALSRLVEDTSMMIPL